MTKVCVKAQSDVGLIFADTCRGERRPKKQTTADVCLWALTFSENSMIQNTTCIYAHMMSHDLTVPICQPNADDV